MITAIQTLHAHRWDLSDLSQAQREPLLALLEEGGVICLPELPGPAMRMQPWSNHPGT